MTTAVKNIYGPFWPLGLIAVPTPGTSVKINSLVDPTGVYSSSGSSEYAAAAQKITFSCPITNAGQIYVVVRGGSKTDTGTILYILQPGSVLDIAAGSMNRSVIGIESLSVDADVAADAVQVTAVVQ